MLLHPLRFNLATKVKSMRLGRFAYRSRILEFLLADLKRACWKPSKDWISKMGERKSLVRQGTVSISPWYHLKMLSKTKVSSKPGIHGPNRFGLAPAGFRTKRSVDSNVQWQTYSVGTVFDISFDHKDGLTVIWSYGVDRYAQRFDCTHDRFMKIPNQFKISIENVVEYLSSVQHHVEHWLET